MFVLSFIALHVNTRRYCVSQNQVWEKNLFFVIFAFSANTETLILFIYFAWAWLVLIVQPWDSEQKV